MSPTTIPAMLDGLRLFGGLFWDALGVPELFVLGLVSIVLGIAAIAGVDEDVVELGGFERDEGERLLRMSWTILLLHYSYRSGSFQRYTSLQKLVFISFKHNIIITQINSNQLKAEIYLILSIKPCWSNPISFLQFEVSPAGTSSEALNYLSQFILRWFGGGLYQRWIIAHVSRILL